MTSIPYKKPYSIQVITYLDNVSQVEWFRYILALFHGVKEIFEENVDFYDKLINKVNKLGPLFSNS